MSLAELSGDTRPPVDNVIHYSWRVNLVGTKEYDRIEHLKISFCFSCDGQPAENLVSIREIVPMRESEEKAKISLTILPLVQVSLPVIDERVIGRICPEGAEWQYLNIELPNSLSICVMGAVAVAFQNVADSRKFRIGVHIEPSFCGKQYGLRVKRPQNQPRIASHMVSNICKDIIPYDPVLGRRSLDSPDTERILEYDWEIDEGILKKAPGIRNVALRAETLSLWLSELRENMKYEDYERGSRAAGKRIGKSFIDNIERTLNRKLTLEEWSDYDSAAGMGKFIFHGSPRPERIVVKNSFVAYNRKSNTPVCEWLSAYFEGALEAIFKMSFSVLEKECIAKGDQNCVFYVNRKGFATKAKE